MRTINEYIKLTKKKSKNIIISCHKHSIGTTQTVYKHVKRTLKAAETSTLFFTVHSTRHFIREIHEKAVVDRNREKRGWKSTLTFRKLYNLPTLKN